MRLGILIACAMAVHGQERASVRILLGVTDTASAVWDGSVQADGAAVESLEPWRFEGADAINGSSWKASTHQIRLFGGANNPSRPIVANGVVAILSGPSENATVRVTTAQGNFDFKLSEIPYGTTASKLNGKVLVERVPAASRLTQTPDEEDFPSAAVAKDGSVWLAYSVFHHHPDHNRLRVGLKEPIKDFAPLKAPTGGDQIFVRHCSGGNWEQPIAVTPAGGDLYRTAIAIDGSGRPWVFWSQNSNGNFDIFGLAVESGKPGRPIQVSKEAGSDINPVAVTDSTGKVWVAWQGWKNGKAGIFAASQKGSAFSAPASVSKSAGNEWNPAIAADRNGHVTVAWDSYRNGNYDVYLRTSTPAGSWGGETAVAATPRYEAYPSIAYDGSGRLWVAYEEGGRGWGKDYGAYNTQGIAIYQGRAIRIRGFESDGRRIELASDVGSVLPGMPRPKVDNMGHQSAEEAFDPNPETAKNRAANQAAQNQQNPRNTMPRLLVDGSGRIWLAFRSMHPTWWTPIGTVYTEYVVSFDGSQWMKPVFITHSDNLLDNRPALVSAKPGQLLMLGSSDSRREFWLSERAGATSNEQPAPPIDPFNNDLYMNEINLAPAQQAAAVVASAASGAPSDTHDSTEVQAVMLIRDYRSPSPDRYRIVRGEFHRHSEISMDGGNDGSILDQWRYIIDAGGLDWVGCCDHDNGGGREYTWWLTQKLTDIFYAPGAFVPMFNYERSVVYPEGHRNVIFAQRGIRPLPRLPVSREQDTGHAPDTQMLYAYLKFFNGIVAAHTSGTNMGTDWRDNDPQVEPVVEIYQGHRQNYEMPGAPRSNTATDSIGGWRPKGFVSLALDKGYKLSFQASSDHISTHISYCNILVKDLSRDSVLDGLHKRHVYAATDNILAEVRSGGHIMGDVFSTTTRPSFQVSLTGTARFAKVYVVRDNNYVYSAEPKTVKVSFSWMDNSPVPDKASYYYVRAEQENGEIVWVSPMWITYTGAK
jgi:hypothetical protein